MQPIYLIGGGGHCKSCIDVIESEDKYRIEGIFDNNHEKYTKILGYQVLGNDSDISKICMPGSSFLITVGQIKTSKIRERIVENFKDINAHFPSIISPNSIVSKHARIGDGNIIMHGAIINASVKIGDYNIINSRSLIEHDTVIGDYNHISTGAILNGTVVLGNGNFIGSSSILYNNILISDNAIIPAGSIVRKNINSTGIYRG